VKVVHEMLAPALAGAVVQRVGAGFTPARPNDSSAFFGGTCAYRRTRRREAGAYMPVTNPIAKPNFKGCALTHRLDRFSWRALRECSLQRRQAMPSQWTRPLESMDR